MITLYSMPSAGNSYKVRLLLAKLAIPFRHVAVEFESGITASAEFRKKNPNGKVPLLELEDGRFISESNAILLYLGEGTLLVPDDSYDRALVHQWMFWEQNFHESSVAVRAAVLNYEHRTSQRRPDVLDPLMESGIRALSVMETQLAKTNYLAGDQMTMADICLYAYTHTAGSRGGFPMEQFPAVYAWLARVSAAPGHVPIGWLGEN